VPCVGQGGLFSPVLVLRWGEVVVRPFLLWWGVVLTLFGCVLRFPVILFILLPDPHSDTKLPFPLHFSPSCRSIIPPAQLTAPSRARLILSLFHLTLLLVIPISLVKTILSQVPSISAGFLGFLRTPFSLIHFLFLTRLHPSKWQKIPLFLNDDPPGFSSGVHPSFPPPLLSIRFLSDLVSLFR